MGLQDLHHIERINRYLNDNFPEYQFIPDFDTQKSDSLYIDTESGWWRYGTFDKKIHDAFLALGFRPYTPDFVSLQHKKIIEYQEEAKKTGRHTIKGHDELSDGTKDEAYKAAGFAQLKIWESDDDWQDHIKEFLEVTEPKKLNSSNSTLVDP